MKHLLVPLAFLLVFLSSRALADYQLKTSTQAKFDRVPEPGTFPDEWIWGFDCATEPELQVHAYNDDLYIIRQSKCETYEAPFLYLIFGTERVFLFDTGANSTTPVRTAVLQVIDDWLLRNNQASIDLVVAHTHTHGDHVAADPQFVGFATDHVGHSVQDVKDYYGLPNWPDDQAELDLGGRILDVIPTPGHHPAEVSFYDRRTNLFLSGDIIYPGHLFIFSPEEWPDFIESQQRMLAFAQTNPVEWVVGCHVEYSEFPGVPFKYTTPVQPREHQLHFKPTIIQDVLDAALSLGGDPECTIFDEFVIHPVYKCGITWNG